MTFVVYMHEFLNGLGSAARPASLGWSRGEGSGFNKRLAEAARWRWAKPHPTGTFVTAFAAEKN